jgi:ABC-type transport system involved in multi-copper enzyme maturation permease subunit
MKFPIAERELRVAARSPRTFRGRLAAGACFGLVTMWLLWLTKKAFNQQAAAMTYTFVTNIALMMCMFSAAATSDAISSEKRGGTLGFLFLTDLKGADVVFGKLLASGLVSFYGLLATIPMISMPVLMGGISGQSIFRCAVALVNGLFLALSLGLWVSTRSWEQKKAANAAMWLGIFFLWMLPGIAIFLEMRLGWFGAANFVKVFSPAFQIQHANPYGVGMLFDHFWTSVVATHALGWLALAHSCVTLPHRWQDRPEAVTGKFRKWWSDARFGSREARKRWRKKLLKMNAVHWLTSRERFAPVMAWFFVVLIVLGWIGIWFWLRFATRGTVPIWGVGIASVMALQIGLRLRTCALAAEVLARDRFSGALELLLSTSLSLYEVSRGIWMTARRVMLGPAIACVGLGIIVFMLARSDPSVSNDSDALLILLCTSLLFAADLIASVWTGMWMSCRARQPNAAAGLCFVKLVALPSFSFLGLLTVMNLFEASRLFDSFAKGFVTWFIMCMANNIFWIKRSRRKFYEEVRIAAAERFQPPRPNRFWTWIRGGIFAQAKGETPLPRAVPVVE